MFKVGKDNWPIVIHCASSFNFRDEHNSVGFAIRQYPIVFEEPSNIFYHSLANDALVQLKERCSKTIKSRCTVSFKVHECIFYFYIRGNKSEEPIRFF